MKKSGFVYIMTNKHRTTLYIGVTNDLCRRVYEHKNHLVKGSFTDRYNLEDCIYYEEFPYFNLAIQREKELKKWNRQKKEDLIKRKNPDWKVLVSEHGFIRENKPFSEQVADLLKEVQENIDTSPVGQNKDAQKNEEIPPVGRNDAAMGGVGGEKAGGAAASLFSTPRTKSPCHSVGSEESPFPTDKHHSVGSEESFFPTDKPHSGGNDESPSPRNLDHSEHSEKTPSTRDIGHSEQCQESNKKH